MPERPIAQPQRVIVDTAADGFLALALARTTGYDVIVTDISMPHMDGIELGKALRADPATAEVVIIVHSALDEGWVRGSFAGYDLFLAKPQESDRVGTAILELLHERSLHHGIPAPH